MNARAAHRWRQKICVCACVSLMLVQFIIIILYTETYMHIEIISNTYVNKL